MKAYYDLHIHSCLSPCSAEDMTPQNIVNMAVLKGLDIIAVTDHNAASNSISAFRYAKGRDITVIPGMELCTSEEIHLICLFRNSDDLEIFNKTVYSRLPEITNRPEIFGEQIFVDEYGKISGNESRLLLTAADMSIDEAVKISEELGGVCYPAHIDRDSFSILSVFGLIPEQLGFSAVEITKEGNSKDYDDKYTVIVSSDAHRLEEISEKEYSIELDRIDTGTLFRVLQSKKRDQ